MYLLSDHLILLDGVLFWTLTLNDYPDPVFFLHHTEIDRLWWLWQHDHGNGEPSMEYLGKTAAGSKQDASLADMIDVGSLGRNVTVREVMETNTNLLCYSY